MKNYKIFLGWQLRLPAAFLRREIPLMLFHRRQNAEVTLESLCIVVVDVVFNHRPGAFCSGEGSSENLMEEAGAAVGDEQSKMGGNTWQEQ